VTAAERCIRPDKRCAWSPHNYKHFAAVGTKPKHTVRPNAARYLPSYDEPAVKALEAGTACDPFRCRFLDGGKAEYLREIGEVIGWDDGKDATLSYVECSGGTEAGRAYHGRPMHDSNPKVAELSAQDDAPEAG
jgi:hypothetical protein